MKLTKRFNYGALLASLLLVSVVVCAAEPEKKSRPSAETIKAGRALFDERCKTVAGEKIYRTVEDVEGIVLLKVRPKRSDADLSSRDWAGAAFARESREDEFIKSFLGYEHSSSQKNEPVTLQRRGFISSDHQPKNASNLPGYRYVDVADEKTGEVWRYSLVLKPRPASTIGWIDTILERQLAPSNRTRYGVTYEDHVIPEERALGLASSTVRVLDLKTQEVLGEMTMYAWTPGVLNMGPRGPASAVPWLSAYRCGNQLPFVGAESRQFSDQILKPHKEK